MGDRPSDSMQPNSKRRASVQATKDQDDDDDDQGQDPGSWKPNGAADPEIAKRRKVKVRRAGGAPEPTTAVDTGEAAKPGNPFEGVSLAPPAAGANPFAGFNLTAPAAAATQAKQADTGKAAVPAAGEAAPGAEVEKATTDVQEPEPASAEKDPKDKDANVADGSSGGGLGSTFGSSSNAWAAFASSSTPTGGFGAFKTPEAGSTGTGGFGGGGFASLAGGFNTGGTGGFAKASTPAGTLAFGSTPPVFSFGTGSFPAPKSALNNSTSGADGNGEKEGDGEGGSIEVFAESSAEFKPVVELPDTKVVTGEEDESVCFSAAGTLYEFDMTASKWRERGKGEFRLNTDKAGQARMVMRQAGNYRLLLNAKVYHGMAVQRMAGDVGVSFACANVAPSADAANTPEKKPPAADADASGSKLTTWAFKVKSRELVDRLHDMLNTMKDVPAPKDDTETPAKAAPTDEAAV